VLKKKIWANFQRIIELLQKKLSKNSEKCGLGIRDPGSGKNLFRIPDPGIKKAPDPGSGSTTLLCFKNFKQSLFKGFIRSHYFWVITPKIRIRT
jgi:hypothetical protein